MPYAVIEKEMEGLDEAQQNAVIMFIRFLVSQKRSGGGAREMPINRMGRAVRHRGNAPKRFRCLVR